MAVQLIMQKAFLSSLEALHEKGISPSADLTPVYVGKFCYIGKLALDEYYPIDERILGVAALVLTGVISWEKGWGAFKWVPEFILPVALDKSIGFLTNCYSNSTDRGRKWKSKKHWQRFILTSAIAEVIFKSLGLYLMRSRNPKIFLRSAIPLMIGTVGYSLTLRKRELKSFF